MVEAGNTSSHEAAPLLYGLAAAYLLGGPVMHAVHGNAVHSIESLLLRAGAVVAGVVTLFAVAEQVGCETEGSDHGPCRAAGYLITMPALAAMLVDDLLLARDAPAQPTAGTHVSTRVVVQPGLAMLGIGGTF